MQITTTKPQPLTREAMASRVAQELESDWVVNIGIGMPTMVMPYVPASRDVIFHSENGIIGMGREIDDPEVVDNDLLSAGKRPVTLLPGGCFVHHADSFALARGGKLDAAILGGYQVAENGDFANWKLPKARTGSIGGAMDIAVGARRVFVMMTHCTDDGEPKLLERLTYPMTARGVVTKIFSDMGVVSVTPEGFRLDELAPGFSFEDVQAATGARLARSPTLRTMPN